MYKSGFLSFIVEEFLSILKEAIVLCNPTTFLSIALELYWVAYDYYQSSSYFYFEI